MEGESKYEEPKDDSTTSSPKNHPLDVYIIEGHGEQIHPSQHYKNSQPGDNVVQPYFIPAGSGDGLIGIGWHANINTCFLSMEQVDEFNKICTEPKKVSGGNTPNPGDPWGVMRGYHIYPPGQQIEEYRIACDCGLLGGDGNCLTCQTPNIPHPKDMGIYLCTADTSAILIYGLEANAEQAELPQGRFTLSQLFQKIYNDHQFRNPHSKYIVHLRNCRGAATPALLEPSRATAGGGKKRYKKYKKRKRTRRQNSRYSNRKRKLHKRIRKKHSTRKRRRRSHRRRSHRRRHSHRRRSRRRQRRGGNGEADWAKKFHENAEKNPILQESIKTWGSPGSETKSLAQLYKEVKSDDCKVEFTDNGPLRVINVVQMEIYPTTKQQFLLKERKHFSPDDLTTPIKERDMLLSEKIQGKETPIEAAIRGIAEELGANHKITVITTPQFFKENTTNSWSYPNLQGVYRYYLGKAIVEGLPSPPEHQSFQTTEFNNDEQKTKKRIIEWIWKPQAPTQPTAAAQTTADN